MTVIEADGVATEPLEVDSIQVFAAQRYSVIVTANQTPGNFCMYIFAISCFTVLMMYVSQGSVLAPTRETPASPAA